MPSRKLHTTENLRSDLKLLGVRNGADLIVHVSLRSLGKVMGGYRNFLEALLLAVGPDGTILAPSFYYHAIDPMMHNNPPDAEYIEIERARIKPFNKFLSPSDTGAFGDIIRLDYRGTRSDHPMKSWSAIGARAGQYTENVPVDDADGLQSPIGRVYTRGNGQILLAGVDHVSNTSLHLAESLARSPHYLQTKIRYKDVDGSWKTITGCGGCSHGFYKVRGIIDFTKYEIKGRVGDSLCILIEQKPFVDSACDSLRTIPYALLCDNPICGECSRAREIYGIPQLEEKEIHLRHPWASKE
jgi:aminoglycoside 3-N-acetyltransferase